MDLTDPHAGYTPIKRKVRYDTAPYPEEVACLFEPYTEAEQKYLWNFGVAMFFLEWAELILYALVLVPWLGLLNATWIFGPLFVVTCIQHNFVMHDAIHAAQQPPSELHSFTFCMLHDVMCMSFKDWVVEHAMHHKSTQENLAYGEFGWDPVDNLFYLQSSWWTVPLLPLVHMAGMHDFGLISCLRWYAATPRYNVWGRIRKHTVQLLAWSLVWLLGCLPAGLPLAQGWKFALSVYLWSRFQTTLTFFVFHHWAHGAWWMRSSWREPSPTFDSVMSLIFFGKGRLNGLKFHDVHHAYYAKMGDPVCRSRFLGADRVEKACLKLLHDGLWKDEE